MSAMAWRLESTRRDDAIGSALDLCARRAARATFFVVRRGVAEWLASRGEGAPRDTRVVLATVAALTGVLARRRPYLGPLEGPLASDRAWLCPVLVRGIPVGILHADGLDPDLDVAWAEPVARELGTALERLIVESKHPPSPLEPARPMATTDTLPPAMPSRSRRAARAIAALGGMAVLAVALGAWSFGSPVRRPAPTAVRAIHVPAPAPVAAQEPAPTPFPAPAATATLRIEANRKRAWVEIDGGARQDLPLTLGGLAPGSVLEVRAGAPRCLERTTRVFVADGMDRARIWLPRRGSDELAESPF